MHLGKGLWTLAEVQGLHAACRLPPPAAGKGIWTLEEVVAGLKAGGLRVWGADLGLRDFAPGPPEGGGEP